MVADLQPARFRSKTLQRCPECGSTLLYKDGFRYLAGNSPIQRWLCRDCGYRFSADSKNGCARTTKNLEIINTREGLSLERQVCELLTRESKNLTVTQLQNVAGEINQQEAKGLLLQYGLYLEKEGYGKNSRYLSCIRMLINSKANMNDPEDVKRVIASKAWKDGTKMQVCYAYDALLKMLKQTWAMPRYRQEECYPFIPESKEIDALILSAGSKRMTAYLQCLKETMADPSEALRICWTDINANVIMLNHPVKGHYPRPLQVTNELIAMLNSLPKTSELVFPVAYNALARCYGILRKRVAHKTNNPRILKITLTTFRHYGATLLYFQTKNILLVKKLLGHKKIENTMKYTQLVSFKDTELETATATTPEEAAQLRKAGFEKYDEFNGIHLYSKPKRYMNGA